MQSWPTKATLTISKRISSRDRSFWDYSQSPASKSSECGLSSSGRLTSSHGTSKPAKVTIPAGIQSGEMLRLRGLGLPDLSGHGRGDELIRVAVWTPEELTAEQEELIRRLQEIETPAPETIGRKNRKGFWSRMKEVLSG